MPRYEYEVSLNIRKRGKIQIDGPTESAAYEKFMDNLDSGVYDEDLSDFFNDEITIEVEDFNIIEEE